MERDATTIAVVDDEEPVRKALDRLPRASGFATEVFASGAEFVAALATRVPECVVLDLHMPGLGGLAVLNWMRHAGCRSAVIDEGTDVGVDGETNVSPLEFLHLGWCNLLLQVQQKVAPPRPPRIAFKATGRNHRDLVGWKPGETNVLPDYKPGPPSAFTGKIIKVTVEQK